MTLTTAARLASGSYDVSAVLTESQLEGFIQRNVSQVFELGDNVHIAVEPVEFLGSLGDGKLRLKGHLSDPGNAGRAITMVYHPVTGVGRITVLPEASASARPRRSWRSR